MYKNMTKAEKEALWADDRSQQQLLAMQVCRCFHPPARLNPLLAMRTCLHSSNATPDICKECPYTQRKQKWTGECHCETCLTVCNHHRDQSPEVSPYVWSSWAPVELFSWVAGPGPAPERPVDAGSPAAAGKLAGQPPGGWEHPGPLGRPQPAARQRPQLGQHQPVLSAVRHAVRPCRPAAAAAAAFAARAALAAGQPEPTATGKCAYSVSHMKSMIWISNIALHREHKSRDHT